MNLLKILQKYLKVDNKKKCAETHNDLDNHVLNELLQLSVQSTLKVDPNFSFRNTLNRINTPLLLHFTNVENLQSIIKNGLLPVNTISSLGISANRNDEHRLDGHLNSVSLSLGFPNYKMFYKYRMINPHKNWVVLGIDSNIILEKKCAFCKRNAADHRIRQKSLNSLMTGEAFEEMFQDIDGFPSRESQNLKNYYTTDPQAEILVFDRIAPKDIKYVFFDKKEVLENFSYLKKESIKFILDNNFFKKR